MLDNTAFNAEWISPPGDTILSLLTERGFEQAELAKALNWQAAAVNELINGDVSISEETASILATMLGATPRFWMKREARYRSDLERLRQEASSTKSIDWLKAVPAREMAALGWIPQASGTVDSAAACLQFFGVPRVDKWNELYTDTLNAIAFRTSKAFVSGFGDVAAWLRQGEILASQIKCAAWNHSKFCDELPAIRELSRVDDPADFMPKLVARCAECGVAVVFLRAPAKCKASGAARFFAVNRPMLLLSGRHRTDDHFWFTFFHEAGHLALHGDKFIFVDGLNDEGLTDNEEEEANRFAANILVPPEHQAEMLRLKANRMDVMRFAKRIGVSRGVIVGQLQHHGVIRRDQLNPLKVQLNWASQ